MTNTNSWFNGLALFCLMAFGSLPFCVSRVYRVRPTWLRLSLSVFVGLAGIGLTVIGILGGFETITKADDSLRIYFPLWAIWERLLAAALLLMGGTIAVGAVLGLLGGTSTSAESHSIARRSRRIVLTLWIVTFFGTLILTQFQVSRLRKTLCVSDIMFPEYPDKQVLQEKHIESFRTGIIRLNDSMIAVCLLNNGPRTRVSSLKNASRMTINGPQGAYMPDYPFYWSDQEQNRRGGKYPPSVHFDGVLIDLKRSGTPLEIKFCWPTSTVKEWREGMTFQID